MRTKDTIILEQLYTLVLEGKRENIAYLEKLFGDDYTDDQKKKLINRIINVASEPDGKPAHIPALGKYIKELKAKNDPNIKPAQLVLKYYPLYMYFKNTNQSLPDITEIKNFSNFKEFLDEKQNNVLDKKGYIKGNDIREEIKQLVEPWDYLGFSKIYSTANTLQEKDLAKDLYKNYKNLTIITTPLAKFNDLKTFDLYVSHKSIDQATKEHKEDNPYLVKYYEQAKQEGQSLSDVLYNYKTYLLIMLGDANNDPTADPKKLEDIPNFGDFLEYVHTHDPQASEKIEKKTNVVDYKNSHILYEDDKIKVWLPQSPHESIEMAYANGQPQYCDTDKGQKWCTTYPVKDNMYFYYRLNSGYLSTFYYILFKKYEDKSNKSWFSSLQANHDNQYMYTPAPNGTQNPMPWEAMLKNAESKGWDVSDLEGNISNGYKLDPELYFPKSTKGKEDLNKIKNNPIEWDKFKNPKTYHDIFKWIPLDLEKSRKFESLSKNFSIQTFNSLSDEEKREYVEMGYEIRPEMWEYLVDEQRESWLRAGSILAPELRSKLGKLKDGNDEFSLWKSNRRVRLGLMIGDAQQTNPELNEFDFEIMADSKNNFIDKIIESKKQRIIEAFLDYYSKHNPDLESNPTIFRLVLASPKRCKNAILKKMDNGKKLEELDPRYMEGVVKDTAETESLIDQITQHGTNFGDIPPVLYRLIIESPLHSSKLLMHQLKIDNKPISEIDAKLINKAFENIGTQQKVFRYLKQTNRLKALFSHPDVNENIKEWIHYYDPDLYKSFKAKPEPEEKPKKGKKKVKKEEPKVDNDDGDLDFSD
jgi:hypothetical protein